MTKEGGGRAEGYRQRLGDKVLEEKRQNKIGFEGRNLADFFFENFLTSCIIGLFL